MFNAVLGRAKIQRIPYFIKFSNYRIPCKEKERFTGLFVTLQAFQP